MRWWFADCEADARELRELAAIPADVVAEARTIGRAAGVTFSMKAPRGCLAQVDLDALRVYLHARGHPWTRNFGNAHELLHVVQALGGEPFPHDEERVDWGAAALLMPRGAVVEVLRRASLDDPPALRAAFPLVPREWVLLRAAWIQRRPVAVHQGGHRHVWAPEEYAAPERGTWWETRLVREVRTTMELTKTLLGAVGVPIGASGAEGVLVIYPEAGAEGW